MHHRVIGAVVGGWLTLQLAVVFAIPPLGLAAPLVAALGATRYGQRFARPALALTGGVMAGLLTMATAGTLALAFALAGPLALIVAVAVTAILWSVRPAEYVVVPLPTEAVPASSPTQ